jgi:hypothetical protein
MSANSCFIVGIRRASVICYRSVQIRVPVTRAATSADALAGSQRSDLEKPCHGSRVLPIGRRPEQVANRRTPSRVGTVRSRSIAIDVIAVQVSISHSLSLRSLAISTCYCVGHGTQTPRLHIMTERTRMAELERVPLASVANESRTRVSC